MKGWKEVDPKPIKINIEEIPEIEMRILCTGLLEDVKKLWKDPKFMEGFDEWIKTYKYRDKE